MIGTSVEHPALVILCVRNVVPHCRLAARTWDEWHHHCPAAETRPGRTSRRHGAVVVGGEGRMGARRREGRMGAAAARTRDLEGRIGDFYLNVFFFKNALPQMGTLT